MADLGIRRIQVGVVRIIHGLRDREVKDDMFRMTHGVADKGQVVRSIAFGLLI